LFDSPFSGSCCPARRSNPEFIEVEKIPVFFFCNFLTITFNLDQKIDGHLSVLPKGTKFSHAGVFAAEKHEIFGKINNKNIICNK
jgi:hypothetical protein